MYDDKQTQDMRQRTQAQELISGLLDRGRTEGWLVDKSEITCGPVLGKGAFGTTYAGTWRGANVAIKVVRVSDTSELINFLREVQSMCVLKHPNILTFLGAVLCSPTDFWLLTEFMPGGTLAAWLHPTSSTRARQAAIAAAASKLPPPATSHGTAQHVVPNGSSSSSAPSAGGLGQNPGSLKKQTTSSILHLPPYLERLTMALEVAQGLMALESCTPPIIHRDIKPSNVLIDAFGHARLADFGLSRQYLSSRRAEFTGETGTYLYMAPEMMRHEVYDCKVDVWSWGVLLVESITCQMPYVDTCLSPEHVALGVADHRLRPSIPSNIDRTLKIVADMACSFDPGERGDFQFITHGLKSAIDNIKGNAILEPMGLLSRLHYSLTSPWGEILGRVHPVSPQFLTPSSTAKAPREKLNSHRDSIASGGDPMDSSNHKSPPTSHSSSSGNSSPMRDEKPGTSHHAASRGGVNIADNFGSNSKDGGDSCESIGGGGGGGSGASGESSDVHHNLSNSAPFD